MSSEIERLLKSRLQLSQAHLREALGEVQRLDERLRAQQSNADTQKREIDEIVTFLGQKGWTFQADENGWLFAHAPKEESAK